MGRSAPPGDSESGCSAAKAVRGAAKRAMANIIASATANENVVRANARAVTGGPFRSRRVFEVRVRPKKLTERLRRVTNPRRIPDRAHIRCKISPKRPRETPRAVHRATRVRNGGVRRCAGGRRRTAGGGVAAGRMAARGQRRARRRAAGAQRGYGDAPCPKNAKDPQMRVFRMGRGESDGGAATGIAAPRTDVIREPPRDA